MQSLLSSCMAGQVRPKPPISNILLSDSLYKGTFFDFHKVIDPLINPPSPDLPA